MNFSVNLYYAQFKHSDWLFKVFNKSASLKQIECKLMFLFLLRIGYRAPALKKKFLLDKKYWLTFASVTTNDRFQRDLPLKAMPHLSETFTLKIERKCRRTKTGANVINKF